MAHAVMVNPQTTLTLSRNFQKVNPNNCSDDRKTKIINTINKNLKWGKNGFQLNGKSLKIEEISKFLYSFYLSKRFHLKPAFIMGTSKDEYWKLPKKYHPAKNKKNDRVTATLNKLNKSFLMTNSGFAFGDNEYSTINELRSFLCEMKDRVGLTLKLGLVVNVSGSNSISSGSSSSSSSSDSLSMEESSMGDIASEHSSIGEVPTDENYDDDELRDYEKPNNISEETTLFSCPICEKNYKSKKNLSVHTRRVHSEIKHKCERCGRNFTRKDSLNAHMTSFHPHDD